MANLTITLPDSYNTKCIQVLEGMQVTFNAFKSPMAAEVAELIKLFKTAKPEEIKTQSLVKNVDFDNILFVRGKDVVYKLNRVPEKPSIGIDDDIVF